MIALVGWGWALIGIAVFLGVGLLGALALGAAGAGGDFFRRVGQTAGMRRSVYRGVELPREVPEAGAEQPRGPSSGAGNEDGG